MKTKIFKISLCIAGLLFGFGSVLSAESTSDVKKEATITNSTRDYNFRIIARSSKGDTKVDSTPGSTKSFPIGDDSKIFVSSPQYENGKEIELNTNPNRIKLKVGTESGRVLPRYIEVDNNIIINIQRDKSNNPLITIVGPFPNTPKGLEEEIKALIGSKGEPIDNLSKGEPIDNLSKGEPIDMSKGKPR